MVKLLRESGGAGGQGEADLRMRQLGVGQLGSEAAGVRQIWGGGSWGVRQLGERGNGHCECQLEKCQLESETVRQLGSEAGLGMKQLGTKECGHCECQLGCQLRTKECAHCECQLGVRQLRSEAAKDVRLGGGRCAHCECQLGVRQLRRRQLRMSAAGDEAGVRQLRMSAGEFGHCECQLRMSTGAGSESGEFSHWVYQLGVCATKCQLCQLGTGECGHWECQLECVTTGNIIWECGHWECQLGLGMSAGITECGWQCQLGVLGHWECQLGSSHWECQVSAAGEMRQLGKVRKLGRCQLEDVSWEDATLRQCQLGKVRRQLGMRQLRRVRQLGDREWSVGHGECQRWSECGHWVSTGEYGECGHWECHGEPLLGSLGSLGNTGIRPTRVWGLGSLGCGHCMGTEEATAYQLRSVCHCLGSLGTGGLGFGDQMLRDEGDQMLRDDGDQLADGLGLTTRQGGKRGRE
ncbi:hypothetical protein Hamer_G008458 [Homarus americanus]|uniref:Uncharacterized protein n=1 Tax=Homarus americanus TaxID=6706 RepID=A0A8J5N4G9_HOMAM|nr:hypothetical protein Hamer_G008458 [Homarus americanus]